MKRLATSLLLLCAGCAPVIYKDAMPTDLTSSTIRAPSEEESQAESSFFQPGSRTWIHSIVNADTPGEKATKIGHAQVAVPQGAYRVLVECVYSVYPVKMSNLFEKSIVTKPGYDYLVECVGIPKDEEVTVREVTNGKA